MKIIKKGRPQKGWSCQTTCTGMGNGLGGCGAILLVETPDLFKTTSSARDETTVYITFKCVGCGVLTDLDDKKRAPPSVTMHLPSQREWEDGARAGDD